MQYVSSKTRNLKMSINEPTYASLTILLDNTTQYDTIDQNYTKTSFFSQSHNDRNGVNYTNSSVMARNHLNTLNDM